MISSRSFVRVTLFAGLALMSLVGQIGAADDREPYRIRLVLSVARHPLLTKTFQEQVARELKDGLQAALGDLAKVEVAADHPKLEEIRKQGLGRWLDQWNERSPYQTHFVQIDYARTTYMIQTRQHDGLTGLSSPVVRSDRTRDPAYVGRTAALLIERNLGLLGTVESEPDGNRLVQVSLKGGKLGVELSRWVKKGEVFGLVSVTGDLPGREVKWTVLQVEETAQDGVCTCRLYTRTLREFSVKGLRCVLLGTLKGPLRLRLVRELKGGETRPGLTAPVTVQIRHNGFEGEDATKLQETTNGKRDVDTARYDGGKGVFNKLAFVTILLRGDRFVRVPVALVDEGPIVLGVPDSNAQDHPSHFRLESLRRNVQESSQVQKHLFERINSLTGRPEKLAEALAEVRKTLERSKQDYFKLSDERDEMANAIAKMKPEDQPPNHGIILKSILSRLEELRKGESELLGHLKVLEKIEEEEKDPKRKEWRIQQERAKALVNELELGQAIEILEKAPPEFMTPELKKHIENLKDRWKTSNEKHEAARRFIYTVWPTLSTTAMKARMKEAQEAVTVCKKAIDVVGMAKMLKTIDQHVQRMEKERSALNPDVNIDDVKQSEAILSVTTELRKLQEDVSSFLEKHGK